MAPWPEQGSEPKGPDKKNSSLATDKSQPTSPVESMLIKISKKVDPVDHDPGVSALSESELKELLDEALSYKNNKDVEGKSPLFKELLHSVDDKNLDQEDFRVRPGKKSKKTRKHHNRRGSSELPLPDLVQDIAEESSARSKKQSKEVISTICTTKKSQEVIPVNNSNKTERSIGEILENVAENAKAMGLSSVYEITKYIKNNGANNVYVPSASDNKTVLVPFSDSQISDTNTCEVDSIERPQIDLPSSYSSVKCIVGTHDNKESPTSSIRVTSTVSEKQAKGFDENGNALSLIAPKTESASERKKNRKKPKNDEKTILSENIEGHRGDIAFDIEAVMKYIESPTGTSDGSTARNLTRTSPKVADRSDACNKKGKRKVNKMNKCSSLEELSSTTKLEQLTKKCGAPIKMSTVDDIQLDKELKQQSNKFIQPLTEAKIVEEIPKKETKVEDVIADTEFRIVTKKQRRKKRQAAIVERGRNLKDSYRPSFRSDSPKGRKETLYRYTRAQLDSQRRKSVVSAPSSEKSDSSDVDSVHSLPVSSSSKASVPIQISTSTGSTPLASYADIARSVASPPREESCSGIKALTKKLDDLHFGKLSKPQSESQLSSESVPTVILSLPKREPLPTQYTNDIDKDYPPLENLEQLQKSNDMFVEYTVVVPKKEPTVDEVSVEETVTVKFPALKRDVALTKTVTFTLEKDKVAKTCRPPVVMLHEEDSDPTCVKDLEFGFELNEDLLKESSPEGALLEVSSSGEEEALVAETPQCSSSATPTSPEEDIPLPGPSARACSPDSSRLSVLLYQEMVVYIAEEWNRVTEELAKGTGSVQYYTP